jgi:acyl-CoA thioesterase-1
MPTSARRGISSKVHAGKTAELARLLGDRLRAADAQMPTDRATGKPIEWPDQVPGRSVAVRVACLGDSITFGAGADPREQAAYPVQLSALLGNGHEVRNFGVGGTTLLTEGDKPYRRQPQFQAAMDFDPDIVLVLLGANDTCGAPRNNWDRSASFESDARTLIQSLRRPGRRVIVALPSPFLPETPGLKPERTADLEERRPRLEQIRGWWREAARAEAAEVVDLHGTLAPEAQFTGDGVHPTRLGYERMARRFHEAILGRPASEGALNQAAKAVPERRDSRCRKPAVVERPPKASGRAQRPETGSKLRWTLGTGHGVAAAGWAFEPVPEPLPFRESTAG